MCKSLLLTLLIALPVGAAEPLLPEGLTRADFSDKSKGLRRVDLNGDSHDDLIYSNSERYGVHLYNPVEKKNLGWLLGWTHTIRSGLAGEAEALPLTTGTEVQLRDGALWVGQQRFMSYAELCRPPAPAPRSPADSLAAIQVKPGFVVELVAHEPLVQDPIYIDWDAQGQLWVVEMGDYPFHEYQGQTHAGRVKRLRDTNADGHYDEATLFLDGLQYPTGLAPWKDGVFVASVPEVFYAKDEDGDGRADSRKPILQGFKEGNPQHLVNGFSWGLDGWLYGGNGDSGGVVTQPGRAEMYDLSGRDFRFHPGTGDFQLQSGRAQYGRYRNDWGDWFACNNSHLGWHYLYDDALLAGNPQLALPTAKQDLNPTGKRMFPISQPMRRFNQPDAVGLLTSGSNLIPWRDSSFGPQYQNSAFICEPAQNLVHQEVLRQDGVSYRSQRAEDETQQEFLASRDNWSRFTQARLGPDGCLYVVDFYRLILEHPEWIPQQMIQHLDLYAGADRGRIYRIRRADQPVRAVPALAGLLDTELGQALRSENGWVRDTAQRLLLERGSGWAAPQLMGNTAAQVQQLWTMHTLKTLGTELLLSSLSSALPKVKEAAARISTDYMHEAKVAAAVEKLLQDSELRVRFQAVFALRGSASEQAYRAVAWRDHAVPEMLVALLATAPQHPQAEQWTQQLREAGKSKAPAASALVIGKADPARAAVLKRYAEVPNLVGDATRGQQLYLAICSGCHMLKGKGLELGPDLGTVASKPVEQLLEAILDPNRAVEQRYTTHTVKMKDGRVITGLLAEETASSLTLKLLGSSEVLLRAEVQQTTPNPRSLMPEGLETVLTPQAVADVLAWMRAP